MILYKDKFLSFVEYYLTNYFKQKSCKKLRKRYYKQEATHQNTIKYTPIILLSIVLFKAKEED